MKCMYRQAGTCTSQLAHSPAAQGERSRLRNESKRLRWGGAGANRENGSSRPPSALSGVEVLEVDAVASEN